MKHLKITVLGRVQGVFFRASTKTEAENLNLRGWCRNRKDGSVYIEVEGDQPNLDSFENWCKKGPQFAKVTSIKVEEGDVIGFKEFEIRRG